jgi:hypothetical protein
VIGGIPQEHKMKIKLRIFWKTVGLGILALSAIAIFYHGDRMLTVINFATAIVIE